MKEVFIGGMPATSTKEFVAGTFGNYGLVVSCELQHSTKHRLMVKLKMATADSAHWLVRNLNGNMAIGLESPIFVDLFEDSGWMWKT